MQRSIVLGGFSSELDWIQMALGDNFEASWDAASRRMSDRAVCQGMQRHAFMVSYSFVMSSKSIVGLWQVLGEECGERRTNSRLGTEFAGHLAGTPERIGPDRSPWEIPAGANLGDTLDNLTSCGVDSCSPAEKPLLRSRNPSLALPSIELQLCVFSMSFCIRKRYPNEMLDSLCKTVTAEYQIDSLSPTEGKASKQAKP